MYQLRHWLECPYPILEFLGFSLSSAVESSFLLRFTLGSTRLWLKQLEPCNLD